MKLVKSSDYSVVTFTIRRSVLGAFRQKHPKYGDTSRIMRELMEAYSEGRVVIHPKKGSITKFPATA